MKSQTLRSLLDGQYICEFAFPREFEWLSDSNTAEWVNLWLSALELRLTRVCDDGAFFVAPIDMQPSDTARIRDEFLRFRDSYGPFVKMLQMVRAAKDDFTLQPGEYLQHAELVQSVNENASLSDQLRSLIGTIRDTEARYTNAELVKRLLEHLRKDGYLVLVNEATEMYRSTGKVTQLAQVLTFLAENSEIGSGEASEAEVVEPDDLFDQVNDHG